MSFIKIEKQNAVSRIILNRPDKHNALNETVMQELIESFYTVAQDKNCRVIVFLGHGKSFCSGADLAYMQNVQALSLAEHVAGAEVLHQLLMAMMQCPQFVIGQVQGAVRGGGIGLVAVCDYVVAESASSYALSEVKLGLIPAVISPFVLKKIPYTQARHLFLSAETFSADVALQYGLVHQVVETKLLAPSVQSKIETILQNSPEAIAAMKQLFVSIDSISPEQAKSFTTHAIAKARMSGDGQEGMLAFLNKQKPRWCK